MLFLPSKGLGLHLLLALQLFSLHCWSSLRTLLIHNKTLPMVRPELLNEVNKRQTFRAGGQPSGRVCTQCHSKRRKS